MLLSVAAWSKGWVYSYSVAGDCGFESYWGYGCLSLLSVVCCQVEVCTVDRSLVQMSPIERDVYDQRTSIKDA